MNWESFFENLLWFIVAAIFLDCIFLEGIFTSALADRIKGSPDKKDKVP